MVIIVYRNETMPYAKEVSSRLGIDAFPFFEYSSRHLGEPVIFFGRSGSYHYLDLEHLE